MPHALCALALLSASDPASGAEIDHRGSVGVALSAGVQLDAPIASAAPSGPAGRVELLATAAVFEDDNEITLGAYALGSGRLVSALGGYRLYFGREEWRTFTDLGLSLHLHDALALGPRLGLGIQWDPDPLFGLFVAAHAEIAFGSAQRAGAAIAIGVQGRSYLLR